MSRRRGRIATFGYERKASYQSAPPRVVGRTGAHKGKRRLRVGRIAVELHCGEALVWCRDSETNQGDAIRMMRHYCRLQGLSIAGHCLLQTVVLLDVVGWNQTESCWIGFLAVNTGDHNARAKCNYQ
jgi:hypothetical protein